MNANDCVKITWSLPVTVRRKENCIIRNAYSIARMENDGDDDDGDDDAFHYPIKFCAVFFDHLIKRFAKSI